MLRLVKWAYDLGVQKERERIAQFLSAERGHLNLRERNIFEELGEHPNEPTPESKKVQLEVTKRLQMVIDNLFHAPQDWVAGASIMFPDEGKKK